MIYSRGFKLSIAGLCTLLFWPHIALAKPKKTPAAKSFNVIGPSGKYITCAPKGQGYVSGAVKGKYFVAASTEKLKTKLEKAKESGNKKLQSSIAKQLKQQKSEIKNENELCKSGASSAPAAGSSSLKPLARALTREDVRYLLEKAGFGMSAKEESLARIGLAQGAAALVDSFMAGVAEPPGLMARVEDRRDGQLGQGTTQTPSGQRAALIDLWAHTNNAYAEKFALFLLGIWTASGDVISDETFRGAWWDYFARLRAAAHASTHLPALALEITRDPLMLIYLNNELNIKGNSNENYARELMELFTLGSANLEGEPNYTETKTDGAGDIALAARALTGWTVKKDYVVNQLFAEYKPARHEAGPQPMFAGKPYQFSAEGDEELVLGIFSKHPGVKYYYAREILKEYVSPIPPRALIDNFAKVIEQNGYNLRGAMNTLLKSEAFFDPAYRDTVPKNSAEYGIELIRTLGLEDALNIGEVQSKFSSMGIEVNNAPSVFWYDQSMWLKAGIVLERANFAAYVISDMTALALPEPDWSPQSVLPQGAATPAQVIEFVSHKLGAGALSADQVAALENYMNTDRQWNGTFVSEPYDNTSSSDQRKDGMGVYYILAGMPAVHLK